MKLNSLVKKASAITYLKDGTSYLSGLGFLPANSGSASVILDESKIYPYFMDEFNDAEYEIGVTVEALKNKFILLTAEAVPLRNLSQYDWKIHNMTGIIRINPKGNKYQIMWGLEGVKPNRFLKQHLVVHNEMIKRDYLHRVLVSASPTYHQQYTYLFEGDDELKYTYSLWNAMPYLARITPRGIGYIRDLPNPSEEMLEALKDKFSKYDVVASKYEGAMVSGRNWDEILGIFSSLDRASQSAINLVNDKEFKIHSDYFINMEHSYKMKLNPEVLKYGDNASPLEPTDVLDANDTIMKIGKVDPEAAISADEDNPDE